MSQMQLDTSKILFRHSWYSYDEAFGDSLTFPLAPQAGWITMKYGTDVYIPP